MSAIADALGFDRFHWGFDLDGIDVPVSIWHGGEDHVVPLAHGEWLAAHVPGARAHLRPGHGHVTFSRHAYGDVLDDLLLSARP